MLNDGIPLSVTSRAQEKKKESSYTTIIRFIQNGSDCVGNVTTLDFINFSLQKLFCT